MDAPAYFELQADEPAAVAGFYADVFGWSVARDDNLPIEYWRLATPGINGAVLARPVPAPASPGGTNAAVISIEVENYDATAARIGELGGRDAMRKFAVPGRCWQGYFLDPAGNTFGIFEVDAGAA